MRNKQFTNKEISDLCLSLSMLLHAGVAPGDGFALMADDEAPGAKRVLFHQMAASADQGMSLPEIFRQSQCFPGYVTSLLEVGEKTGRLEESLASLAKYYEERLRMERQIRTSLLYPAILLLIMLAVIVVLLVKVLPVFDQVYGQLGSSLTGVAGGLLAFGKILGNGMPVLCGLLVLVVAGVCLFAWSRSCREGLICFWNEKFGNRGVSGDINTARVAQVLAMGLKSGLPVEDALELAAEMVKEVPALSSACRVCGGQIAEGQPMIACLKSSQVLPLQECRLLEMGMRSGAGDQVMDEIAQRLQEESEEALARKISRAEPALVLVTSVLIGLILLSVMLPLVHIMAAIG